LGWIGPKKQLIVVPYLLRDAAVWFDGLSVFRALAPPLVVAGLFASSNETNSFAEIASLNPSGVSRMSCAAPAVYTNGSWTNDRSCVAMVQSFLLRQTVSCSLV